MLFEFLGHADYFFLAGAGLWGLFNLHLVWTLVARLRFKNEAAQDAFLDSIAPDLERGDYAAVQAKCEGDRRAIPMLVDIAMQNADMEPQALHDLVSDRFQYDAIAQIEASTAWVSTIIKLAPMLGLIGTVAGMMGAFQTLEEATTSEPTKQLLRDIRIALDHTLIGLLITVSCAGCHGDREQPHKRHGRIGWLRSKSVLRHVRKQPPRRIPRASEALAPVADAASIRFNNDGGCCQHPV